MIRALVAMFSDAYVGVIRALVHEHGHLPVTLHLEPANRADCGAVAVVSTLSPYVVGGRTVYSGSEHVGQRIGYIVRVDATKQHIAALLIRQDEPIHASLVIDGANWWIELGGKPDEDGEGAPY